ncbi:MAG: hypothetical protein ACXAEU_00655 [Candidatus Hodarchaeales archaeon]
MSPRDGINRVTGTSPTINYLTTPRYRNEWWSDPVLLSQFSSTGRVKLHEDRCHGNG